MTLVASAAAPIDPTGLVPVLDPAGSACMLPAAAYLDGEYGIKDLYFGVPVVLGAGGVEKIVELPLTDDEKVLMNKSVELVRGSVDSMRTLIDF